jgi:guanosine-3',5'-bis(diphosphate) 3'-pyrophosphohydrolase
VVTVERVLAWRRQVQTADALTPLIVAYRERHPKDPLGLITSAYETAAEAHAGQLRNSGEAYISHPLAVATILASLGLDEAQRYKK